MLTVKNKHRNILIIGKGETQAGAKNIVPVGSYEEALETYGHSDLSDACKLAFDFGASELYLVNTPFPEDILDVANTLRDYDFAYVVPVSTLMSDYFIRRQPQGKRVYFMEYMLRALSGSSLSTVLATDKHASLYEDIDHFLGHMTEVKNGVRTKLLSDANLALQNLCFVANNLKNHRFANVIVAAMLCTTPFDEYPKGAFGPAVFDLDALDVGQNEMAYFKNSHLAGTTLENLVNFCPRESVLRYVLADRMAKYILREIDLNKYKGRMATPYQRLRAEEEILAFLESQRNRSIEGYRLGSVGLFRDKPGSAHLLVEFDIYPMHFKEKVSIRKEL